MQLYDHRPVSVKQKLIIPRPDKYLVFNGFPLVGRLLAIAGANLTNK